MQTCRTEAPLGTTVCRLLCSHFASKISSPWSFDARTVRTDNNILSAPIRLLTTTADLGQAAAVPRKIVTVASAFLAATIILLSSHRAVRVINSSTAGALNPIVTPTWWPRALKPIESSCHLVAGAPNSRVRQSMSPLPQISSRATTGAPAQPSLRLAQIPTPRTLA